MTAPERIAEVETVVEAGTSGAVAASDGMMDLVRRGFAGVCVGVVLAAGCGSEPAATKATVPVRSTPSTPGNIGSARATSIAESMAVPDARGNPILSRPTDARAMTFEAALTAIGSSEDYSHAPSAPVWLVHVYGAYRAPMMPPPRLPAGTATSTPSSAPSTSAAPRSFFVVIDAITGQIAVENY